MSLENQTGNSQKLLIPEGELSRYPEPDLMVSGLTVELFERLHRENGTNVAVVDLDNMLADAVRNRQGGYDVDEASVQALRDARHSGILKEYSLLSNIQIPLPHLRKRVEYFAQRFDTKFFLAATYPNSKPNPRGIQKLMQQMKAKPEETVVIGDQLGKDVLVARNIGSLAVLRYPHFGQDPFYRQKKRKMEQGIIKSLIDIQVDKEIKSHYQGGLDFLNNFYGNLPISEHNGAYRILAEEQQNMDKLQTQSNASPLLKSKTRREFFKDVDDAIVEAGLTNDEVIAESDLYFKNPTMEADARWFKFQVPIYKNLRKKGYEHPDLVR